MDLKAQLLDFLVHLPATDSPDERKALVMLTGFSHLAIHLDWQGSQVEFFPRLLEELARRGQTSFVTFLSELLKTDFVSNSIERREKLTALRAQLEALDEAAWQQQFAPTIAAPSGAQPVAADLLATTVISTILTPYLKLGAEGTAQQVDARIAQLAKQVLQRVETALAADAGAMGVLTLYKQQPETGQAFVLPFVKSKLEQSPELAQELAQLIAAAESAEPEKGLQSLVDVAQQIGTVSGTVVGAVVGGDVLQQIQAKIAVKQEIDRVEAGGTVTGAVLGGSGPMNIGGIHHHNEQRVETGGGAFIGGGVNTGGGDFTGRDKYVGGDEVRGDKGIGGAELAALFAPILQAAQSTPLEKRGEALQAAQQLRDEVAKGKKAQDETLAGLIEDLVGLVPGAVSAVVGAFGSPLLAGIAGPATTYVLKKIGLKA